MIKQQAIVILLYMWFTAIYWYTDTCTQMLWFTVYSQRKCQK